MLSIIASWKLLVKSGEKGWKVLIPFYGDYVMFKQFYDKRLFWNLLVGYCATLVLAIIAAISYSANVYCDGYFCYYPQSLGFFGILAIIAGVITITCNFVFVEMLLWYTGKAFDAKPIHCLAMMFATPFALILLGFDEKFVYTGNKRPFCIPKREKKEQTEEAQA